jgi:hypothetical protein
MGLVSDIVILPIIEAYTLKGTPITIGFNDPYKIDEAIPACDLWYRFNFGAKLAQTDYYIVTPDCIKDNEWTNNCSFLVDAEKLESAIGEDND